MVEQQDLDLAAVVGIDDTGAGVDEVLGCETGAGRDAAVWDFGETMDQLLGLDMPGED